MRLLIIGGSGRTGKLVIEEALQRGHKVTALVRDSNSVQARPGLTVVRGSPLNKADIEVAVAASPGDSPTAVIVALNSTRTTENLLPHQILANCLGVHLGNSEPPVFDRMADPVLAWSAVNAPKRLMADSHANLVSVMQEHGISKIVTMSAFGTGDSFPNLNFLMRLVIKTSNLWYTFLDHDLVDQELKESGVQFVLARPAMLTDKEARPVREHGNTGKESGFMPSISRKSVAVFLVDAAEKDTWNKSTPVISN